MVKLQMGQPYYAFDMNTRQFTGFDAMTDKQAAEYAMFDVAGIALKSLGPQFLSGFLTGMAFHRGCPQHSQTILEEAEIIISDQSHAKICDLLHAELKRAGFKCELGRIDSEISEGKLRN